MKTLNIAGKTVIIDTEKLSKGLCNLHEQNEEIKTILAFGMLDAKLCEIFEKQLTQSIKNQFSLISQELFKDRINDFCKDCNNEITKGVYKYAKMIV